MILNHWLSMLRTRLISRTKSQNATQRRRQGRNDGLRRVAGGDIRTIETLEDRILLAAAVANYELVGPLESSEEGALATPFGGFTRYDDVQLEMTDEIGWGINHYVSSNTGSNPFNGLNVNELLGADAFYDAGFTGSNAVVANVEAGHVWNLHETLGRVSTLVHDTSGSAGPQTGEFDRHATWVAQLMAGAPNNPVTGPEYQRGIAYDAELLSGAIATQWNGSPFTLGFSFNSSTFFKPYADLLINGVGTGNTTADVVNSSWGNNDLTGSSFFSRGLDALAAQSAKTVVFSAGNAGPDVNTVGGPAAGYNVIAVAALGADTDVPPYETVSGFSSRGKSDLFIPSNPSGSAGTTLSQVRSTVDIAAPGQNITGGFYGGTTGGNTGGTDNSNGATNFYTFNLGGTSFAAPTVAGGATLIADAARATFGGTTQALDGRVNKAVLLNSANKIPGWDNAQTDVGGVITTTQSLDLASGAGAMNLTTAYDQLLSGTTDVPGLGGGTIDVIGWDYGQVSQSASTDYFIGAPLEGGSEFTATLTWFVDRSINLSTNASTEDSFDDLNLEVWEVVDGNPTTKVAESISDYNTVEHLSFTVPATGEYMIRTVWDEEHWDFVSDANTEQYGLAWSGTQGEDIGELRVFGVDAASDDIVELDLENGSVINSFAVPGGQVANGDDGLAFDGTSLFYIASPASGGDGALYELDPDTGAIIDSDTFTSIGISNSIDGLGILNGQVVASDYQTNNLFFIDPVTDSVVSSAQLSVDVRGGVTGADSRGTVFASIQGSGQIFEINPTNGVRLNTIPGPFDNLGLAFIDGFLYASRFGTNDALATTLFRLDPDNGEVLGSTLFSGIDLTALAGGANSSGSSISGTIWEDVDADGVFDGTESPLANWEIYLDLNDNGALDVGEPTQLSGVDGTYTFSGLAADTYTVREVLQNGWENTFPNLAPSSASVEGLMSAITTTGSTAPIYPAGERLADDTEGGFTPQTAQSGPLINVDDFRADPRFAGIDGTGYSVVVLDTGIDLDHSFFGPDLDSNGIADRIVYSYDFADGDPDATDFNGHGSNVTSIATSSDSTHTGMAPGANIIHLKVFTDGGSGNFGFTEAALQWVVQNVSTYNIASVNMSLGDGNNFASSQSLYGISDELAALASLDVIVASSAGNDFFTHTSVPGVAYPAADGNSLAVGAVFDASIGGFSYGSGAIANSSGADRLAPFSQRHTTLTEVFAPGAAITGASASGGTYTSHGTSQASPHIAGIAALAQQLAQQTLGRRLTLAEFRQLLVDSNAAIFDGDDEDDNVTNTNQSYGRVDVFALGEAILALGGGNKTAGNGFWTVTVGPGEAVQDVDFGNRQVASGTPRLFGVDANADTIVELDPASGNVINTFPVPGGVGIGGADGLAFDGTNLFLIAAPVTGGDGTLYELNPDSGAIIDSDTFTQIGISNSIDGLGVLNGQVVASDYQSNNLFFIDPVTDSVVGSAQQAVDVNGGAAGADSRGTLFTNSNGSDQIFEINPSNGTVINSFSAPSGNILGLAFIDGVLYASDPSSSTVFRLNPDNGSVLGSFSTGLALTALAGRFSVTGNSATISGTVWEDVDADGVFDVTESPLANWEIYLDLNDNAVLDVGEPTQLSAANGTYTFTGLTAGTYVVREVLQSGWEQTFPISPTNVAWEPLGPGPALDGQVENVGTDDQVVGAIHTVAAHPTDPDILYIGATNGGIWKTTNATAASPNWLPLTDDQASLSTGALEFDPTDPTGNTLVAGIGRASSFGQRGGARTGLLHTTDGGATWNALDGGGTLIGKNISGVAARGNTIVAAVNVADAFTFGNIGIFRSTDGGATFSQVSVGNGSTTGLPGGVSHDLAADPTDPSVLYTSVTFSGLVGGQVGVYKSTDTGATWTKVSNSTIDVLIEDGSNGTGTSNLEIAVGNSGEVYAAVINTGNLAGFFRSGDGGATWVQMDTPSTNENGTDVGLNPRGTKGPGPEAAPDEIAGGQGSIHFSVRPDPTNSNIVYVGGDRQPRTFGDTGSFPNSIGAVDFTGRLFRGDASQPTGNQWVHLTHSNSLGAAGGGTANSSAPHADSREIVFSANGDLIEVDDGGIYRRTSPRTNTGDWFSLIGDLQVTEAHDVAWDSVSDIAMTGNQDTGSTHQVSTGSSTWVSVSTADGGDIAIDDTSTPGRSFRYSSFQNLGAFRRREYDASNNLISEVFLPTIPDVQFVTPVVLNAVDATRLVIGGSSRVYESLNQGGSNTEIPGSTGANRSDGTPLVYGHVPNPNLIVAGVGDQVQVRTGGPGSSMTFTSSAFPGQTIRDIVLDPSFDETFFVADSDQVFLTTNLGANWTEVTGNLASISGFDFHDVGICGRFQCRFASDWHGNRCFL